MTFVRYNAAEGIPIPKRLNVEETLKHSYRDFHVKGFDYICLRRTPELTIKLYFFDGDIAKAPEVVNPHDHRYDFATHLIRGRMQNSIYEASNNLPAPRSIWCNRYNWYTPLLGGDGFAPAGIQRLIETSRTTYQWERQPYYHMQAEEIHTIRMLENETVLMLLQYGDKLPTDQPTKCFVPFDSPTPKITDCYKRWNADDLIARLQNFEERTGHRFGCPVCGNLVLLYGTCMRCVDVDAKGNVA